VEKGIALGCRAEAHLARACAEADFILQPHNERSIPMSQHQARIDPYQLVTDLIIQHLERGTVPWRCPWHRKTGPPINFHTGKPYRGANILLLGLHHLASPYWLTFCQARERGGSVRKGERGAMVVKFGKYEKKSSDTTKAEEKKESFFLRSYTVFNAVQIDGIDFPAASPPPQSEKSRIDRAEEIVRGMPQPPVIREGRSDRAVYMRGTDVVEMPAFGTFETPENFHATLFHELVHSTGHQSRLNRKSLVENDGFGGNVYSQEELVAEMGAAFLAVEADIVRDEHEQSASYLQSWLTVLRDKDHRRWIVQSANQAGRAADFILGRTTAAVETE